MNLLLSPFPDLREYAAGRDYLFFIGKIHDDIDAGEVLVRGLPARLRPRVLGLPNADGFGSGSFIWWRREGSGFDEEEPPVSCLLG